MKFEELRPLLEEVVGCDIQHVGQRPVDFGEWDSLTHLRVIVRLSKEYNKDFDLSDWHNSESIEEFILKNE